MSLEVKTYDVAPHEEQTLLNIMYAFGWTLKSNQRIFNRTSRPTSAFTYGDFTYINSETETNEFSTLTFERDTNIPHYREISELEAEFWDLAPHMTSKRPLPPPPKLSFAQWAANNKPKVIPMNKRVRSFFLLMGIFFATNMMLFFILLQDEFEGAFIMPCLLLGAVFALIANAKLTKARSAKELKNPNSDGYAIAYSQYKRYEDNYAIQEHAPAWYDRAQVRVPKIIAQSKYLLDDK